MLQGWQYGNALIHLRPIFRLTKLAFPKAPKKEPVGFLSKKGGTSAFKGFVGGLRSGEAGLISSSLRYCTQERMSYRILS